MTRIKGGLLHAKRRRGILKHTKGFRWGRKSKMKVAKVAKMKAGAHAFVGRRVKKRERRQLNEVKINAAARKAGTTYSRLIGALHKKNINLNRVVLAQMALNQPKLFAAVVEAAK